jgi:hypothetical protein
MKKINSTIIFLILFFAIPLVSVASVRVNEIAWMGTQSSASNEWIELYNEGSSTVDLNHWSLVAEDGSPKITLNGKILSNSFYLMERTDDASAPGVSANMIYSGALSNSGETLMLKNASGSVVQTINDSSGWKAGDNSSKNTMTWSSGKWITASPTPKAENSDVDLSPKKKDSGAGGKNTNDASSTINSSPASGGGSNSTTDPGIISTHADSVGLSTIKAPVKIYASAGRNRSVVAGRALEFSGKVFDAQKKLVKNGNFAWSFGDGSMLEGKKVHHAFAFPGTYNVVLNVDGNGTSHAVARIKVYVHSANISLTDVQPGKIGFVEITNKSKSEINLGGYQIIGGKKRFIFPQDTIVDANQTLRFPNEVTGMTSVKKSSVSLLFPKGQKVIAKKMILPNGPNSTSSKKRANQILSEASSTLSTMRLKISSLRDKIFSKGSTLSINQKNSLVKAKKSSPKFQGIQAPKVKAPKSVVSTQTRKNPQPQAKTGSSSASSSKKTKKGTSQTASAADSVVVVKSPVHWWSRILHFFF